MAWLTGYAYRKKTTITGQAGAGTNYQVKLQIGNASGGNFNLNNHSLSFPNDIRFTSSDGSTQLNYWIENVASAPITVWIKVIASLETNVDIYCYYGKASDTTTSNGTNTFILFDDFLGSSINSSIWSLYAPGYSSGPGTITVSNSVVTITGSTNTWWALASRNIPTINIPFKIEYLAKCINGANGGYVIGASDLSAGFGNDSMQFSTSGSVCYSTVNNTVETRDASPTPEYTSWTRLGMGIHSGSVDFYVNGSLVHTNTTNIPDEAMGARFMAAQWAGIVYVDWVHTSKYSSPEPTFSTTGSEELGITTTAMTLYQSETPCRTGICTITADVTWQNLGSSSITFRPKILIDGITEVQAASDITIDPYPATGSSLIATPTLSAGTHSICPYPN